MRPSMAKAEAAGARDGSFFVGPNRACKWILQDILAHAKRAKGMA